MLENVEENFAVAVYDSHAGAETAIRALHRAGLDLSRLSIVGNGIETEDRALGFYAPVEFTKNRARRGAAWGALWGLLIGGTFCFTFAIKPMADMRSLVTWWMCTINAAAVGAAAGVLATAMTNIGLAKGGDIKYKHSVKCGNFAVVVRGTAEILVHARAVLGTTGPSQPTAQAA